jgi:2-phosphosulfolactate phosphatase
LVIMVDVELIAKDAKRAVARGDLIIVIDVLRSGTSILNGLVNGAEAFVPVRSLKEAYELHRQHPRWLLAGERGGNKPKGFDLGNSPLEFAREKIEGKTIVFTTTSGTLALIKSECAKCVVIGTFLNAQAVAQKAEEIAAKEKIDISFVLAGERGKFSLEDFLCSGAILDGFTQESVGFSDKGHAALLAFTQSRKGLLRSVMRAEHAKTLARMGFKADVHFSCQLNTLREVPFYMDRLITLRE